MPIRKHLRKFYRGAAWQATRARMLARAGDACEACGKPNHAMVWVMRDGSGRWAKQLEDCRKPDTGAWLDATGKPCAAPRPADAGKIWHVQVVLTIAHLNHLAGDDRDENLRALCQRCHLAHDRHWHLARARRTRALRTGQKWLIDASLPASIEDLR